MQRVKIELESEPRNEAFARVAVAAFAARLNPTIEEISDIKTAVSEAVTNAIIHGYNGGEGKIMLICSLDENELDVEISDEGVGIQDIEKAMEPMFTSKPELERSGMGFAFMSAFMDKVTVDSTPGKGTIVRMKKKIAKEDTIESDMDTAIGYN